MYGPLVGINNLQPTEGNVKGWPTSMSDVAFLFEEMKNTDSWDEGFL